MKIPQPGALCALFLSFALSAAAVSGQTPTSPTAEPEPVLTVEDEIVVSATRGEVPLREVGSSVTVIPREEIERRGSVTVLELLRAVPGLEVVQTGGPGGTASLFLRGSASSHTLVLLDGVRINDPASGSFDWADLTVDGLERIEVLRGPQSALYGSEAIGGVVSLFSRRGEEGLRGEVAAEAGSHDFSRVRAALGGGAAGWDWSLAASRQETDGVSRANEAAGNREDDPWENLTAAAALGRAFLGDGRAELSVRAVDSAVGLDAFEFGIGPVDDPNYRQDRRSLYTSLALRKPLSPRWTGRLRVGAVEDDLEARDPDPEPAFHDARFESGLRDAEVQADFAVSPADTLSFGAAVERREAESPGAYDASATVRSVYAENRWAFRDRLFLTAGARRDDHSIFGAETTWRAAGSWELGPVRLRASAGTGFKAPTFIDLYFPFYGNPELDPERSRGFDAGIDATFLDGALSAGLTAFSTDFEDLISFDLATFRAANVAEAEVRGVEAELGWRPAAAFEAKASYTRTDSEDLATGLPLARRPKHRATLTALFQPTGRLRGSFTAIAVRDRIDSDLLPLDDYERLDATLDYAATPRAGVYLRVENLLDEEIQEIRGFTTPGATAVLGLRVGVGGR